MSNKKNFKDLFSASDDDTMMRIGNKHPAVSESRKDELFSRIQQNVSGKNDNDDYEDRVSGVEIHRSRGMMKYVSIAAACAFIVGGLGGGVYLLGRNASDTSSKLQYAAEASEENVPAETEIPTEVVIEVMTDVHDAESSTAAYSENSEIVENEDDVPGVTNTYYDLHPLSNDDESRAYIAELLQNCGVNFDKVYFKKSKRSYDNVVTLYTVHYDKTNLTSECEMTICNNDEKRYEYTYKDRTVLLNEVLGTDKKVVMLKEDTTNNVPNNIVDIVASRFLGIEMIHDEQSKFDITGTEEVCGRMCAVVEQRYMPDNIVNSKADYIYWIDLQYGLILKTSAAVEDDYGTGCVTDEITEIYFNDEAESPITPAEFKQMLIEGGYENTDNIDLSYLDE